MVPAIARSNRIRQEQCIDTPFMMEPLLSDFGYLVYKDNAQTVIDREYVPSQGTFLYAVEFIETLKMPRKIRELEKIGLKISAAINKSAWRKQKERTTSAHDTPGYNHYKTLSFDKELNEIDTFMRNFPVTVDFAQKNGAI